MRMSNEQPSSLVRTKTSNTRRVHWRNIFWLPNRYLNENHSSNGIKCRYLIFCSFLSLCWFWPEKNHSKEFFLRFVHAKSSSHSTININVVAQAGTPFSIDQCAVQFSCRPHQCERRLNENVTTKGKKIERKKNTKEKKRNNEKRNGKKIVRKKCARNGLTMDEWEWTFNVGFDHFCASSFCSSHYF